MTPGRMRPLPPELKDELRQTPDGAELAHVWELLGVLDSAPGSAAAARDEGTVSTGEYELAGITESDWPLVAAALTLPETAAMGASAGERHTSVITAGPATVAAPVAQPAAEPGVLPLRRSARRPLRWAAAALAASLTLALGIGTYASRPVVLQAPGGAVTSAELPDGSRVELNAGSTLTYSGGFRNVLGLRSALRDVALEGEAFFDVATDGRPFVVLTSEAEVTVLGTRFLVRARDDGEAGTFVAVESGRVRVSPAEATEADAVILTAGEGTRVDRRDGRAEPVTAVGIERLTTWRRGGLALVDQPLDLVVRELARRYNVPITMRGVSSGKERLTLYYPDQPAIEVVLSDICATRGLRFQRVNRGYEISPDVGSIDSAVSVTP